jgi:hypothetical protein
MDTEIDMDIPMDKDMNKDIDIDMDWQIILGSHTASPISWRAMVRDSHVEKYVYFRLFYHLPQ